MVVFETCDSKNTTVECASQEEISTFLIFKYFMTVDNSKRFIQYEFGSSSIIDSAESRLYPLSPTNRLDFVNKITRTKIVKNDDYLKIG